MNWKQPVENLEYFFGEDYIALLIWERLLIRARNTDDEKAESFAGTLHFLERGQCVFGDHELSLMFNRDRKTIRNALKRLIKRYNKVDIKRTSKGSIATIKNYDEVIGMGQQNGQQNGQQKDNRGTTKGQQKDTNKNDKSVKNDKSEESNTGGKGVESIRTKQNATVVLKWFNKLLGTNFKAIHGFEDNLAFWMKTYNEEDIKRALEAIKDGKWWAKDPSPTLLFRRKSPTGEHVDYIGELINKGGGSGE